MFLNNLGNGSFPKSRQTRVTDDQYEALVDIRKAVDVTPASHNNYAMYMYNFAECALHMHNCTGDVEYMKRALTDSKETTDVQRGT